MFLWSQLFLMLIIILIATQLFANALEYFSQKVGISSGVTGSILAAISTALPETTVPILAIISGTSNALVNQEISVGAILGAPLMLSTLSSFIMAISVVKKRTIYGKIAPEITGFKRDINFFLIAFWIAAIAMYVPHEPIYFRATLSAFLVCLYICYIALTFRASKKLVNTGFNVIPTEPLLFTKIGFSPSMMTIIIQLLTGLGLLLIGAKGFINKIHDAATALGMSTLLLSLLIIPLATELPEKVNSVVWVRKNKDTLGFGNITGAMVFQGTLLPALGILLTPWQPSTTVLTGVFITIFAAAWLKLNTHSTGIPILALCVNGLLYLLYLGLVI